MSARCGLSTTTALAPDGDTSVPEAILEKIAQGHLDSLYLVSGDRVVAEPIAQRIATALAERIGCEVDTQRRPASLGPVLADLRTLSLFGSGKVVLVVESRILADSRGVADLIDDAAEALPIGRDGLAMNERRAAGRLLQALRLFQVDPYQGPPEDVVAQLPAWAYQGGAVYRRRSRNRPRGKRQVEDLKSGIGELLAAARAAELVGWAETDLAELSELITGGLPPGHVLVLVERSVAADHPLVAAVKESGAWLEAGQVEATRRGWDGLGAVAAELERETGVAMQADALQELARRTLRQEDGRGG
ncbi:MAG: hypothetical protein O7A04_11380, partial [Acidobacteria bacterium]|nr:hypothetical protein [Acidobacteriota bacterium]